MEARNKGAGCGRWDIRSALSVAGGCTSLPDGFFQQDWSPVSLCHRISSKCILGWEPPCGQNDTHNSKHYLPVTLCTPTVKNKKFDELLTPACVVQREIMFSVCLSGLWSLVLSQGVPQSGLWSLVLSQGVPQSGLWSLVLSGGRGTSVRPVTREYPSQACSRGSTPVRPLGVPQLQSGP